MKTKFILFVAISSIIASAMAMEQAEGPLLRSIYSSAITAYGRNIEYSTDKTYLAYINKDSSGLIIYKELLNGDIQKDSRYRNKVPESRTLFEDTRKKVCSSEVAR